MEKGGYLEFELRNCTARRRRVSVITEGLQLISPPALYGTQANPQYFEIIGPFESREIKMFHVKKCEDSGDTTTTEEDSGVAGRILIWDRPLAKKGKRAMCCACEEMDCEHQKAHEATFNEGIEVEEGGEYVKMDECDEKYGKATCRVVRYPLVEPKILEPKKKDSESKIQKSEKKDQKTKTRTTEDSEDVKTLEKIQKKSQKSTKRIQKTSEVRRPKTVSESPGSGPRVVTEPPKLVKCGGTDKNDKRKKMKKRGCCKVQ